MGAAFKLTDAIDENIVRKLKLIGTEAETTATSYAKLVVEMGKMQGVNPRGIAELEEKASKYNQTVKELHETQKKLNELQNQQKDIYAQVAKQIQEQVKHEKEKAKLEGQMLANENKRLKNQQLLERQNRKTADSQEDITRALNEQAKTMRQASEQNRILRQAMRDTDLTAADAAEKMEMYNRKIMENEELLDKNSDAMIQRKRNIGNYASAWNGLGMSVQQLARELPSLSMGFNTFFLAISNNLPILVDELKRASERVKEMKEAGEEVEPVWKQLGKSIISWQTLLLVGITVLSMYGEEIMGFVSSLFKGSEAVNNLAEAEKALHDARVNGLKDSSKERAELELLYKASQDSNRSLKERNEAVDELQKKYPSYFGNMSNEEILLGKAAAAYDRLKERIIAMAQARAIQDKIAEISAKKLEAEIKAEEQKSIQDQYAEISGSGTAVKNKAIAGAYSANIEILTDESVAYNNATKALAEYNTEIDNYKAQIDNLSKKISISDLLDGEGQSSVSDQLDIDKELADSRIALIEDNRERELAENAQTFKEKLSQIKGNGEKEIELRENLAKLQRQKESEINKKYDEQRQKEEYERQERALQSRINNLDKYAEIEATNLVTSQIIANQELEDEYKQGLIDREEYEREKFEIQKHYNELALRNSIETAKAIISLMPDGADKDEAIAKLRKQMAELKSLMSTEFEGDKDNDWASKKWQEKWSESIEYVSQAMSGVVDIVSSSFDAQIQKIEEEQEKNEEAGQMELERIQSLAEKGVITKEEAEARKRAAEEKTAKKNEELERKKAALQTKQAKLEKAANIASVIMNTAVAIMKAWGQTGIFGAPMAALIGAMGALQLATIVAQPIPKYAKGTDSHKGGLAVVGDGGVSETVITDRGMFLTPNTPTLVNLPKGSRVIPYAINIESMKANASDIDGLMAYRKENELPPITIENDYSGLQRDIKRLEESQRKGFKTLAKAINNQDYKRFAASI